MAYGVTATVLTNLRLIFNALDVRDAQRASGYAVVGVVWAALLLVALDRVRRKRGESSEVEPIAA